MDSDEQGPTLSGRWASTTTVASEPVRSNAVPVIQGWAAKLVEELGSDAVAGASLAMRQMDHFVTTAVGANLGTLVLDDFVEVVEYDPVRHVALVIGMKDAPTSVPLLWLLLRVYPGAEGVVFLPGHEVLEPVDLKPSPRGSFEEAFAVGELMAQKGRKGVLGPAVGTFAGLGTLVVVPPREDPWTVLALKD
jgi:hypothetical protein